MERPLRQQRVGEVTIPRQSRGLSNVSRSKRLKRGRLRGPNSWATVSVAGYFHNPSWSNLSSSFSWLRM